MMSIQPSLSLTAIPRRWGDMFSIVLWEPEWDQYRLQPSQSITLMWNLYNFILLIASLGKLIQIDHSDLISNSGENAPPSPARAPAPTFRGDFSLDFSSCIFEDRKEVKS